MGKSAHKGAKSDATNQASDRSFITVDKKAFDPALSSLFASSSVPITAPPKSRYQSLPNKSSADDLSELKENEDEDENEDIEEVEESEDQELSSSGEQTAGSAESSDEDDAEEDDQSESDAENVLSKLRESMLNGEQDRPNKKRKRREEEVEDKYMQKLARDELKEEEKRKKQKTGTATPDEDASTEDEVDKPTYSIPKHETQMESKDEGELEKASRTVFLGNVSSEAITSKSAKKTLMRHLASFIDDLADNEPPHKVESLRFRSTAFSSTLPKKAAFAKKEVLDATTKSTNAYAVYSTPLAAREAAKKLNGTIVLNRHLRVDSVAHPAKVDHRRCVFVGNLGFVDDESKLETAEGEKKKKNKAPSDIEEGLWVQFNKAGPVESVRVVRDSTTRVGKGFAYVQFKDENGVEAALQFNDQKYPPMLPRKLRVVRAKAPKKKEKKPTSAGLKTKDTRAKGAFNAKVTDEQRTNQGRARAMLGKAAAANAKESFVFEGHRASSTQGHSGLKLGGKKKGGKLTNRSAKRAAAWKKAGGKK